MKYLRVILLNKNLLFNTKMALKIKKKYVVIELVTEIIYLKVSQILL